MNSLGKENYAILPNRTIMDPRHKLAYCFIPKVACSTMKRMFLVLSGNFDSKNPQDINFFVHTAAIRNLAIAFYSIDFQKEVTNNFFKFLVVRNPIDRIWSAFVDTLYLLNWLPVEKYERAGTGTSHFDQEKSQQCRQDFTFYDVLLYTVKHVNVNDHIASYNDLCHPCHVKYDAIVRLETFLSDISYILKRNVAIEDIDLSGLSGHSSTDDTARRIINDVFHSRIDKELHDCWKNFPLCKFKFLCK